MRPSTSGSSLLRSSSSNWWLFTRHARGVELTADGRRFQEAVRDALDRLAKEVRDIRGREITTRVQVSMLPSFATRWLLPRLPQFNRTHPGIDIEIRTEHQFIDFERRATAPDFAIRYGRGGWKGLHAERLRGEHLRPVCAPGAIASGSEVDMGALLSRYPLIRSPRAYYLVCRSDGPPSQHVRVLWDWLLVTAKAGEGSVTLRRTR
jgi:LysR family glycine cleavage system transcriptional activator